MKKLFAMICALTLSCLMLAGCGDKSAEDVSTADSKASAAVETESGAEEGESSEAAEVQSASDTTYARAYTYMLEGKDLKVTMVTSSEMMYDTTTVVEVCGDNYRMSTEQVELYFVDGVICMLNNANMTYIIEENPSEQYTNIDVHSYTMGVEDSYKFIGTETTADGLICETYHAPDLITGEMPTNEEDGEVTVYKYYFEEGGLTPVKIDMSAYGLSQTTTFEEFSFEVSPIELPDLSEWTNAADFIDGDAPAEFE